MGSHGTLAVLKLVENQLRSELQEYEAMLECIPRESDHLRDMAQLFMDLLRERREMLERLYELEPQLES